MAVVWAVSHFRHLVCGHNITVVTDHSTVKAVRVQVPSMLGGVYGCGAKSIEIVYRLGRENSSANALSRTPQLPAPLEGIAEGEAQVNIIRGDETISDLLTADPMSDRPPDDFGQEQSKDPSLKDLMTYLRDSVLPTEETTAKKVLTQAPQVTISDDILYILDSRQKDRVRVVVPSHLRGSLLMEYHAGQMAGHFSGPRLYKTLERWWWWQGMYSDCVKHARNCPQCTVVGGTVRVRKPPLPVDSLFQIVGVDIMDLPQTSRGNRYVVVFQDFLSKFPLVLPVPDQKSQRIAKLLVEEVIPLVVY